jgi:predicted transcriptional regulator of viral defense system
MKYIELLNKISSPIFSIQDLKISGISMLPYQISKLNKDGYIKKIKNGLYIFSSKKELIPTEHIAFKIYSPSYISLEWALHHYGLIPEVIYNITSISTKATRKFKNDFGIFIYRNIKKELFWGYRKEEKSGNNYLIAEPEKALLDYIYFNLPKIKNDDDVEGLRLNSLLINKLDIKKLKEYALLFNNKKIYNIITKIIK